MPCTTEETSYCWYIGRHQPNKFNISETDSNTKRQTNKTSPKTPCGCNERTCKDRSPSFQPKCAMVCERSSTVQNCIPVYECVYEGVCVRECVLMRNCILPRKCRSINVHFVPKLDMLEFLVINFQWIPSIDDIASRHFTEMHQVPKKRRKCVQNPEPIRCRSCVAVQRWSRDFTPHYMKL